MKKLMIFLVKFYYFAGLLAFCAIYLTCSSPEIVMFSFYFYFFTLVTFGGWVGKKYDKED
jgi:hypothetical protein